MADINERMEGAEEELRLLVLERVEAVRAKGRGRHVGSRHARLPARRRNLADHP